MKTHIKILSVFLLLFIAGCGVWQNFTTYFNLYFNTQKLYDEAMLQIDGLDKGIFDLQEPDLPAAVKKNLDLVIEKGSKILQHESESAYFDDALFMTGVAFYYEKNYAKALRKFQELALQNESDYGLQSRLWIARSEIQLRSFDKGMQILTDLKNDPAALEDEDLLAEVYKTTTAYYIDREEFTQALNEAQEFLTLTDDDGLKAEVAYQIGIMKLNQGEKEAAVQSFQSVLDYSPDFKTEFNSKFQLAKLEKELGDPQKSYEMLDDLYSEDKYKDFWGDIYFEIGLLEYENENIDKAFKIFTEVDSLYNKSEGAGKSRLMMGEIMRNVYADYDSAKYYYDRVSNSNVPKEVKEEAASYSKTINSYLSLKKNIKTTNKQMEYLNNPVTFLRDSIAYSRYLAQLQLQNERNNERGRGRGRNRDVASRVDQMTNQNDQQTNQDTLNDSTAAQDSVQAESNSWISAADLNFEDDEYVVSEKPIKPNISLDSLKAKQANNLFDLGNLFFVDYHKLDSAYYYYSKLLDDYPDIKNKPKILFALGAYYESNGQQAKADSIYNVIYNDYKTYSVANEAAKKLDKPLFKSKSDPAETIYMQAEAKLDSSNYTGAITLLDSITENYQQSIYHPKSVYTLGWIYENKLDKPDSAAAEYSILTEEYKNSDYAKAVSKKLNTYLATVDLKKSGTETGDTSAAAIITPAIPDSVSAEPGNVQPDSTLNGTGKDIIENKNGSEDVKTEDMMKDTASVKPVDTQTESLKNKENKPDTIQNKSNSLVPAEPDTSSASADTSSSK